MSHDVNARTGFREFKRQRQKPIHLHLRRRLNTHSAFADVQDFAEFERRTLSAAGEIGIGRAVHAMTGSSAPITAIDGIWVHVRWSGSPIWADWKPSYPSRAESYLPNCQELAKTYKSMMYRRADLRKPGHGRYHHPGKQLHGCNVLLAERVWRGREHFEDTQCSVELA